jgi:hypothetical protein
MNLFFRILNKVLLFLTLIYFLYYFNCPFGGHCYLFPHIQTQFSKDFSHKKFNEVRLGMKLFEVERIIGKPIRYLGQPDKKENYRNGYLLAIYSDKKYSKWTEYEFESIDVNYDKDSLVIGIYQEWWTDW